MKNFAAKFCMSMAVVVAMTVGTTQSLATDLNRSIKDTQPYTGAAAPQPWTLSFTTYSWLPWISGDATVRGRSLDVDLSPGDVLDALDWSTLPVWMSRMELRRGRLGLFNDIVYAKQAGSAGFTRSGPGGLATLSGNVSANYTQAT